MPHAIAVITGSSRGLGLEIARQLAADHDMLPIVTARSPEKAQAGLGSLSARGLLAECHPLDVTDARSIRTFTAWLERTQGRCDVLVNNAGVSLDGPSSAATSSPEDLLRTLDANVVGSYAVTQSLLPLLRRSVAARVVMVSSLAGSLTESADPASTIPPDKAPTYRISKAALNMATIVFANLLRETPAKVNAASPGWVRTAMGGEDAPLTVEEGADTPVWLATLPADGPTGGFFRNRTRTPW